MRRACVFPVLAFVLLTAGCQSDKGPVPVHPAKGQVLVGGKPTAGIQVWLMPTSAPMVPRIPTNPHGVTGPDGRFTLTTYTTDDGAAEGGYQVVLSWPKPSTENLEDEGDQLLGWYGPIHSKLTATIKAGQNELGPWNLTMPTKPPAAVQGIPGRN